MTQAHAKPEPLLWLSDARGVYIPHDFARSFVDRDKHVSGVSRDDWSILDLGPNQESNDVYWETWDDVLNDAIVTDEHGTKYRLHQDGDLWLIPDGMQWNEDSDCYQWPEAEDESCSEL